MTIACEPGVAEIDRVLATARTNLAAIRPALEDAVRQAIPDASVTLRSCGLPSVPERVPRTCEIENLAEYGLVIEYRAESADIGYRIWANLHGELCARLPAEVVALIEPHVCYTDRQ